MRKCLVVVDYQKDFVDGSLGFPRAEQIGEGIARRIQKARADGEDVIFTLDTHGPEYLNTLEGRKLPVEHCLRGSEGWQLAEPVAREVRDEDLLLEKNTFGSEDLPRLLREGAYDQVELCGLVADICVAANAALARTALPQAEIRVDSRLTASPDEEKYRSALQVLDSLQVDILGQDAAD